MLTEEQVRRYSRQLLLPEVGGAGQARLARARVLIVGAGGLGCPAALYLAAAGVGTLGLVDNDPVDPSNLHRQVLHYSADVGRPKVESAREKLAALNAEVRVEAHAVRLMPGNADDLVSRYDLAVDGSDNFPTRYLLNDACVRAGKPLVSGAVLRWEGQLLTVLPGKSACYRCLFPEPPDPACVRTCAEAGVLGAVTGVVGALQAAEALKLLLGRPGAMTDRLLLIDLAAMSFRERPARRRRGCAACGEAASAAPSPAFFKTER